MNSVWNLQAILFTHPHIQSTRVSKIQVATQPNKHAFSPILEEQDYDREQKRAFYSSIRMEPSGVRSRVEQDHARTS